MNILSRKKQDEILEKIIKCQILVLEYVDNIEGNEKITEILSDITFDIGGIPAMDFVIKRFNEEVEERKKRRSFNQEVTKCQ